MSWARGLPQRRWIGGVAAGFLALLAGCGAVPAPQPAPTRTVGGVTLSAVLANTPRLAAAGYVRLPGSPWPHLTLYGRPGTDGLELVLTARGRVVGVRGLFPKAVGLQPWFDQAARQPAPSAATVSPSGTAPSRTSPSGSALPARPGAAAGRMGSGSSASPAGGSATPSGKRTATGAKTTGTATTRGTAPVASAPAAGGTRQAAGAASGGTASGTVSRASGGTASGRTTTTAPVPGKATGTTGAPAATPSAAKPNTGSTRVAGTGPAGNFYTQTIWLVRRAGRGTAATGTAATGTAATGTATTGTAATGTAATGTAATGTAATGTAATGTAPTGTAPTGTATRGRTPTGTAATGTRGKTASGTTATGTSLGGTYRTLLPFNPTLRRARRLTPFLAGAGTTFGHRGYGVSLTLARHGQVTGVVGFFPLNGGYQPMFDQAPGHVDTVPAQNLQGYTQHIFFVRPGSIR